MFAREIYATFGLTQNARPFRTGHKPRAAAPFIFAPTLRNATLEILMRAGKDALNLVSSRGSRSATLIRVKRSEISPRV